MHAKVALVASALAIFCPTGARASTWVWADAQSGYDHLWLKTLAVDTEGLDAEVQPSSAGGPALSLGLGGRLYFVTLGLRGKATHLAQGWLWRVGPELGFRIPLARFEPYLGLGFGYATVGTARRMFRGLDDGLDSDGLFASARLGLDYLMWPALSVGAVVAVDALAMARPGVSIRRLLENDRIQTLEAARERAGQADGACWGMGVGVLVNIGVHF